MIHEQFWGSSTISFGIIAAEDELKPLSDSAVVKLLKEEGLQIARRTVAKYREELRIPSSSQRKRAFR